MIRKKFKSAREAMGLSRAELEALTNSSSGEISRFEGGKSNPTLSKLETWAKALKLRIMTVVNVEMSDIVQAAKACTENENIFKISLKKLREWEKQFESIENENIPQQLSGWIMFDVNKGRSGQDLEAISEFSKKMIAFYKQEHNLLTHQNQSFRHDLINQFVYLFNKKSK